MVLVHTTLLLLLFQLLPLPLLLRQVVWLLLLRRLFIQQPPHAGSHTLPHCTRSCRGARVLLLLQRCQRAAWALDHAMAVS
jgi:hypothetical protein